MKARGWFKKEYEEAKKSFEYKLEGLEIDILEKIAEVMENKGISKSALAQKLGVTKQAITNLFINGSNITLKRLLSIADALDCKVEINLFESDNYVTHSNYSYFNIPPEIPFGLNLYNNFGSVNDSITAQTEISPGWGFYIERGINFINTTQSTGKSTPVLH